MIDRTQVTDTRALLALVGRLLDRVNALDDRVDDLEEFLQEVADDVLDRQGAQ